MLRICQVTAEFAPLAKTGGLADVTAGLTRYLHEIGQDVRLFMPFYGTIDRSGLDHQPVDFLSNIPMHVGGRELSMTVHTAGLPGIEHRLYLIECPALYDRPGIYCHDGDEHLRFAGLAQATIESCQRMGWGPDVFHCHDWHAGLLPLFLRAEYSWDQLFAHSRTMLTIHNLAYQGTFSADVLGELGLHDHQAMVDQDDLRNGTFNSLKTGLIHADRLTTVSRTYAHEIQTPDCGAGLDGLLRHRADDLVGIVNGVDYEQWSPERDQHLWHPYSRADLAGKARNKSELLRTLRLDEPGEVPLAGIVSRLTHQKGFDLTFDAIPEAIREGNLRLVAVGSGEQRYEDFFRSLQDAFPGRVCFHCGYHEELAHRIEGAADMFLMPSLFEPCGLNQMYSLRYGTPPVVRNVGGLADTVRHYDLVTREGTGFVFEHFNADGFRWALGEALRAFADKPAWRQLMLNGMAEDFAWERQGREYLREYARLTDA